MNLFKKIKLIKRIKVKADYYATPKKLGESVIDDSNEPYEPIEINYEYLPKGYFWKEIEFEVPRIIWIWYAFLNSQGIYYEIRDKCYEWYLKRKDNV